MGNKWNKYLTLAHHQNLAEMVLKTISLYSERTAMRWFSEDLETVYSLTYGDIKKKMEAVFGGLCSLGFKKSDRIGLCSETSAAWVYTDLGVQARGAVLVALYPSLKPAEIKYIQARNVSS
jgi:long-chain acyl-CoA synthetase